MTTTLRPQSRNIQGPANWRRVIAGAACLAMIGIGAGLIVSTYHTFNQTSDEPVHLSTGMEWLERGTYTIEPLHPPLGRIAVALGPYLAGLRLTGQKDPGIDGSEILFAHDSYLHNLALARLGTLPFFILAAVLVWQWSRQRYGNGAALVATFLFSTCPIVLAHAGLATTDMAATAGLTAALLAWINFLDRPGSRQAVLCGAALAFAILCKFSLVLFLPAAALPLLLWRFLSSRSASGDPKAVRLPWGRALAMIALTAAILVWAGYRFSITSIANIRHSSKPYVTIDRRFGREGALHSWAYRAVEFPGIPAPALFQGLAQLSRKNKIGPKAYLFGQTRRKGWWYYFPVALGVKTPIPFLIFFGIGAFYLTRRAWIEKNWIMVAPLSGALSVLLVCLPSNINIGARHILPIYPLLAITAGAGCAWFVRNVRPKFAALAIALVLLIWQAGSSFRAHPDYLAWFNEIAGQHPEKILIDSDLDWGQDVLRLSTKLRQTHIPELSLVLAGMPPDLDLRRFGLPPYRVLLPHERATGWIAISLFNLKTGGVGKPLDSYSWLEAHQPVALVGRSIRLYHVPDAATVANPLRGPA